MVPLNIMVAVASNFLTPAGMRPLKVKTCLIGYTKTIFKKPFVPGYFGYLWGKKSKFSCGCDSVEIL